MLSRSLIVTFSKTHVFALFLLNRTFYSIKFFKGTITVFPLHFKTYNFYKLIVQFHIPAIMLEKTQFFWIHPWKNIMSTLNKIKYSAFINNFNQKGVTIYLSKLEVSRTI